MIMQGLREHGLVSATRPTGFARSCEMQERLSAFVVLQGGQVGEGVQHVVGGADGGAVSAREVCRSPAGARVLRLLRSALSRSDAAGTIAGAYGWQSPVHR